MYSNLTNSCILVGVGKRSVLAVKINSLTDVSGCTDSDISVCFSASCRSNGKWDWPIEGVELHGQHGVCLQGRVWVIGRRPRLLSQIPAVNRGRHQALQDLLHFRETNPSDDYTTQAAEAVRSLVASWLILACFINFNKTLLLPLTKFYIEKTKLKTFFLAVNYAMSMSKKSVYVFMIHNLT